jgi:hypothetical protein
VSLLSSIQNQKIFIAALDWGMGHLTRCSAIIQKLLNQHNDVVIFSTQKQSPFYNQLFPSTKQVIIPEYAVNFYPNNLVKTILTQSFRFIKNIKKENDFLKSYISQYTKPDLIISDSRFGFYHSDIKSIIITHQIELQLPYFFQWAKEINFYLINHFDEIWIPDYEDLKKSLAGKLSHTNNPSLKNKIHYILPQSLMRPIKVENSIDYLFVISGTTAEKLYYEKLFLHYAQRIQKINNHSKIVIIGGINTNKNLLKGWTHFDETNEFFLKARNIITRAGYSTLMDWDKIKQPHQQLFLVDSKHQYEQKYLYKYWLQKGWAKDIRELIK